MGDGTTMSSLGWLLVLAGAGCSTAQADAEKKVPKADVSKAPKVDPKADELLHKMADALAKTKSFQFDADHALEVVTSEGETLQFVARSRVAVKRPNQIRSDRVGAVADATLYYDGKNMTIYGKRTNLYATAAAPPTIDAAIDFARDELGLEAPAADLVYSDVYGGLMEDVVSGTYIGLEPMGNRMCHHLAYRGQETDWQIWVEDGARALPCRYVIRSKNVKGTPTFQVAFDNWRIAPTLAANYFEFKPPKGATQIEFLSMRDKAKEQAKQKEGKSL